MGPPDYQSSAVTMEFARKSCKILRFLPELPDMLKKPVVVQLCSIVI